MRWSVPPAGDGVPRDEAFLVLLRWTEELDDERAVTLWAGLGAVEDPRAREAALLRWIDWAGVAVPLGVKLRDLVGGVATLMQELLLVTRQPERVYVYPVEDLVPMSRALQGWMRARESQPGVVLGALQALMLARKALRGHGHRRRSHAPSAPPSLAGFEVEPDAPELERISSAEVLMALSDAPAEDPLGPTAALIASSVRRRVERGPVEESAELLVTWLQAGAVDELPAWGAAAVDFALLVGELQGVHFRPLAELAERAPSVWSSLVSIASLPRDALRAARMLSALASHPDVARELSPSAADAAQEALAMLLSHPRVGVWSRAARAMGRLAGSLPGLGQRLLGLLQQGPSTAVRLRATAALGGLAPHAGSDLLACRSATLRLLDAVSAGETPAHEAAQMAALAVALPDLCLDENDQWRSLAARIAARGGPEAWLAVLRALQEIRLRDPSALPMVEPLALDVRTRAESWRGGSGADAERVERALALATRLASPEDRSPAGLVAELAHAVSGAPAEVSVRAHVDTFVADMEVLIANSARAVGSDTSRVASQGSVVLEELVDLVVEGDLPVIAGRVAEAGSHTAALDAAESLRTRLLKMVWTGLRRPTPAAYAWRRWLIRAAGALPRSLPPGKRQGDVEREQVFETLERLADDAMFGQPVLMRYLGATLVELSQPLLFSLGASAPAVVLTWLALRGTLQSSHVRLRRWMGDDVPAEPVDRLFALMEATERAHHDVAHDAAALGAVAGGESCRMGVLLSALAAECIDVAQRRPEAHWSGLPRFDLTDLAGLADSIRRARDEAAFALTLEGERTPSAGTTARAGESLTERAGRINRLLTSTSLKFIDAARRAEVVEHYLSELSAMTEAIASACGPMLEPGLRAVLAKALVAVRAQASGALQTQREGVRYIARLKVLGELSSAHEGGMTSTFLAEGGAPGKKLVVKLLRWEKFRGTSAELARAMFEGEMERLSAVVHPNIVSIVDAGVVDEGAYIALEYIPGASLETLLRKVGRLDLRALGPIVRDMARALAWLHARKIIHRDIKPGNVIVQLDMPPDAVLDAATWGSAEIVRAVLIDFGVATELTRIGSNEGVTGTPGYIAPEIARGLNLFGPPVDVYALGVVIFELLTGENPFLQGSPELNAVLVRHGSMALPWQKLPPEAQTRPELVQLLAETTRLDPRLRPSMRDFLLRWSKALGLGA